MEKQWYNAIHIWHGTFFAYSYFIHIVKSEQLSDFRRVDDQSHV